MILTINDVDSTADKSVNAEMDGWVLVLFDHRKDGFTDRKGVFRNGKWQVAHRISCDSHGVWKVPKGLERIVRNR